MKNANLIQTGMDEKTAEFVSSLQNTIVDILEEVIRVFDKYQLKYSLVAGSMLGAVRHKGFIPWDDDLDIIMPREDFLKFKEIAATELQAPFFFQDYSTDDEYPSIYAKVRNSNTTLIEKGYRNLRKMNHGIFVDIFVADRYKADFKNNLRRKIIKFNNIVLLCQKDAETNTVLQFMCRLFPRNLLFKITEMMMTNMNCEKDANQYIMMNQYTMPDHIFDELIDVPFDRLTVKISKRHDEMLTDMFKNYMELPPVEKRCPKHMTKHASVSIPYKEYLKTNM